MKYLVSEDSQRGANLLGKPRWLSYLVVVVLGLVALGCSSPSLGAPGDVVDLPDRHPALELLEDGADTVQSFMDTAYERRILADCSLEKWSRSTAPADVDRLEYCFVRDGDVLAVVPFGNPEGVVARIDGDGVGGEVSVGLDGDEPVGLYDTGGELVVIVERDGEHVSSNRAFVESDS